MEGENRGIWLAAGVIALLAAGGGLYYFRLAQRQGAEAPAPMQPSESPKPEVSALSVEQANALLKEGGTALSANPKWAFWLKVDDPMRRFTAAIALIAEGKSPRSSLDFLGPGRPFGVMKKKGKLWVDPKSYARYDELGDVIASIDAQGAARLFRQLKPVLQNAYNELGGAPRDVQDVLVGAIDDLLKTPVVDGDIRVQKRVVSYVMTDPKLEGLDAAQKHLLRMGPKNTVKIQAKLKEFSAALGASESQLPVPETYSPKP